MTNTRATVADCYLEQLHAAGVDTIFGIISIHNIPFYDSLQRRGGFSVMTARHEGAAVNMADGYARATGKLGVVLTSTGTGAGNAAGALMEAWNGGAPVLHITGQVASAYVDTGRGYIHDIKDQLSMLQAVSKDAYRVRRAEEAPAVLARAIAQALAAPAGPVSIEIPIDFQARLITPASIAPVVPVVEPTGLQSAAELIIGAKRPLVWAGGGVIGANASAELRQFVDAIDAAVIVSQSGRGCFPETDPRCIGHFATYPAVQEFIGTGDVLISAGVRFRGNETSAWKFKIPPLHVAIDADVRAIGRNFPVTAGLVGDARLILERLIPLVSKAGKKPAFIEEVDRLRTSVRQQLRSTLGPWQEVLDAMRAAVPRDAILVRDVTIPATTWGSRLIERSEPRTAIHASGGGIGQALPMAIGAQAACRDKTVVAMIGDGGLLVNVGSLATAVEENLPIVIVLFDDSAYGVLRNIQDAHFDGRRFGVALRSPDFVTLAQSFGFESERVASGAALQHSLNRAIASRKPWMIVVDSDAVGPVAKPFAGPEGGAGLYRPHD